MDNFEYNLEPVRVSPMMKKNWKQIASWATFFSIIGFVGVFIQLIYLLIAITFFSRDRGVISSHVDFNPFIFGGLLSYSVIVVALFFIHFYHLKFANLIQKAIRSNDQIIFEMAWRNLRNHFRLYGVVLILYILLLMFVFYIDANRLID